MAGLGASFHFLNDDDGDAGEVAATEEEEEEDDDHDDVCALCLGAGELLMCTSCPRVYHLACVEVSRQTTGQCRAMSLCSCDLTPSVRRSLRARARVCARLCV